MANRRKFIAGLGALATGSAAAVGTGAFSSVSAERSVDVQVADDADALLSLTATEDNANSAYAYDGAEDGSIKIDISDANNSGISGGTGVNSDAITKIYDIFEVENQGTQAVAVYVSDITPESAGDYDQGDLTIDPHATNLQFNEGVPDSDYMVDPGDQVSLTDGTTFEPLNPWGLGTTPYTLEPGNSFDVGLRIQITDGADLDTASIEMTLEADASEASVPTDD